MRYEVADPSQYLVITGAGIKDLTIRKKAWVWPLQRCLKIPITPFDYTMSLSIMTIEKLNLDLPAVFCIGPHDEYDSLVKYAKLLTGGKGGTKVGVVSGSNERLQDIVRGIIEGETRSIVSTMTMDELFRERIIFKNKVIDNVQSELNQFGLRIYNANVKELRDGQGSEYFATLSRKAHEGALNQAKIDVAEARAKGQIGESEKQSRAKQEIAKIDATTAVLETQRRGEKAQADAQLVQKQIGIDREIQIDRINAERAAEARDAELAKDVEIKRANMELERQRATNVVTAKIDRESAEQAAEADLFAEQKKADAERYREEAGADAKKYIAEQEAEANYLMRKAEAAGITELAHAYGDLAKVLGGPQGLMQYIMVKEGLYEKLARENAKAIQGLQPKINVWNTGSEGGSASDPAAAIRNIFQSLPPMFSTIQDQTGMKPPNWLVQMPEGGADADAGKKLPNGIKSH